ncbi:hypothetical protein [Promicromonospora sp. NPDC060271]|uniref:hypothetical protein n=1 Tax=Promicromonospora sp. NPDC060271 TaxID=3347089 RepID=UPI00364D4F22
MAELLSIDDLPTGFDYPPEFIRVVELGITDLEPWLILEGDQLHSRYQGLRGRYPTRILVPFARRIDNDDVACWDLGRAGSVVVIHDFASAGWEQQAELGGFYDWLRQAVEDLIEYE